MSALDRYRLTKHIDCFGGRPSFDSPLIISHRRSGTHFFGELIRRNWKVSWCKSHDWAERLPSGMAKFYIVRNPVDCIWSNWRWWRGSGGNNPFIMRELADLSFHDYLNGMAGRRIGYNRCMRGGDNLTTTRGMMYDPLGYWLEHVRSALEENIPLVIYEELRLNPTGFVEMIADLGFQGRVPVGDIDEVNDAAGLLSESIDRRDFRKRPHPESISQWPADAIERLNEGGRDILKLISRTDVVQWYGQRQVAAISGDDNDGSS